MGFRVVRRVVHRVVRKWGGQIDPAKLVLRGVRRVVRRVVRRGGVRLIFKKLCSEGCAGWCARGWSD